MGAQVPVLSSNDHANPSRGDRRVLEKVESSKMFQLTHASLGKAENGLVKSLLVKAHRGGGGTRSSDPGAQPWVRGPT